MIKECLNCKKEFRAEICNIKLGKARFCSQSCANQGRFNPAWKKGWSIDGEGYKRVYVGNIPKWSNRKKEHRLVLEEFLGRKLNPKELVHHIDGNKLNNEISNLMVMTRQEHSRLHALKRWHRA